MVVVNRAPELTEVLRLLVAGLDVPDEKYRAAVAHYQEIGRWLVDPPSALAPIAEDVYVQGSFRIGTAIRPITDKDEYDIDLVVPLQLLRESTSKDDLKARVASRLRQKREYCDCLKEKRRCHTLHLGNGFHADVLPALPQRDSRYPSRLWIADSDQRPWLASDPIGFAEWFVRRAGRPYLERRAAVALEARGDVAQVPMWRVKTALHRVVQLLKRHRDLYFADPSICELRPASVILTTLAALAHGEETDLWEAFTHAVERLDESVPRANGRYNLRNPVNEDENFTDRWNEDSRLPAAFLRWTRKLRTDVERLDGASGLDGLAAVLGEGFGRGLTSRAFASRGRDLRTAREQGLLREVGGSLVVGGTAGHVVKPHTFYGAT